MALRREIVNLIGLGLLLNIGQRGAVGHIPMMQAKAAIVTGLAFDQVVDTRRVIQRCAAFDAVHGVAFAQQKFGQIRAVLSGDAGDECCFQKLWPLCPSSQSPPDTHFSLRRKGRSSALRAVSRM